MADHWPFYRWQTWHVMLEWTLHDRAPFRGWPAWSYWPSVPLQVVLLVREFHAISREWAQQDRETPRRAWADPERGGGA